MYAYAHALEATTPLVHGLTTGLVPSAANVKGVQKFILISR